MDKCVRHNGPTCKLITQEHTNVTAHLLPESYKCTAQRGFWRIRSRQPRRARRTCKPPSAPCQWPQPDATLRYACYSVAALIVGVGSQVCWTIVMHIMWKANNVAKHRTFNIWQIDKCKKTVSECCTARYSWVVMARPKQTQKQPNNNSAKHRTQGSDLVQQLHNPRKLGGYQAISLSAIWTP